ncbi:YolD-like family protein [Niallia oryzisoli]|uniref:YolD-like family protein n=1 Tax=Niallia oryzisoli TaxID=1737571 RepID=A0ABZ2CG99_9BACI
MIRDRGRIKWVSMMLPEHVKVLREWAEEDSYETKKELDEQQLEIMNEIIAEAMEYGRKVTIIHFRNRKYELLVGHIHSWDRLNGRLHVVDRFGAEHRIELQNIMDVQRAG